MTTKIRTIKGVSTLLCFVAVFVFSLHIFIETHDSATVAARNTHKAAKKQKNLAASQLLNYIDQLNSNQITSKEFSALTVPLSVEHKSLVSVSAAKFKVLNKAKANAKVLSFNNLNVFAFIFGVFTILFIVTILFYIYGKPTEHKTLISSHKKATAVLMTFSLYYYTYTFYPYSDLPRHLHIIAMLLIGFVLSVAIMSVIDWKFEKKTILSIYKGNFKSLFRFIAITAKDYVDPNKAKEYNKKYITEVVDNFKLPEHE